MELSLSNSLNESLIFRLEFTILTVFADLLVVLFWGIVRNTPP